MKLRLRHAPPKDRLRNHIQNALDDLSGKLPPHDRRQLLDDLCFLLRSPLFLYAIAPRLRRAKALSEREATGLMTPDSLVNGDGKEDGVDVSALTMKIAWDGNSWATQLRIGNVSLIEGRQYKTAQEAGFTTGFHWFCEEARFLSYEFHARERVMMVVPDTADASEQNVMEMRMARARSEGKRQRRVVKLKIRYKMVRGKPVFAKKTR